VDDVAARYLRTLKLALTRGPGLWAPVARPRGWKRHVVDPVQALLRRRGLQLSQLDADRSATVSAPETLLTIPRLDHLQFCIERALADEVPGDLVEAGVWRGGAAILMRAVLAAHRVDDRVVWVADSFAGFPTNRRSPIDRDHDFTGERGEPFIAVDLERVRENFGRYDLLDDQVRFLAGWFADTLPTAPIDRIAVLHLDADLHESTTDVLDALEPKVSAGGFVIVDDYGTFEQCRRAVDEYRAEHSITDPIEAVDADCVCWRKSDATAGN
jgi:O-methyltransferase